jgi:hypothetical protein
VHDAVAALAGFYVDFYLVYKHKVLQVSLSDMSDRSNKSHGWIIQDERLLDADKRGRTQIYD